MSEVLEVGKKESQETIDWGSRFPRENSQQVLMPPPGGGAALATGCSQGHWYLRNFGAGVTDGRISGIFK